MVLAVTWSTVSLEDCFPDHSIWNQTGFFQRKLQKAVEEGVSISTSSGGYPEAVSWHETIGIWREQNCLLISKPNFSTWNVCKGEICLFRFLGYFMPCPCICESHGAKKTFDCNKLEGSSPNKISKQRILDMNKIEQIISCLSLLILLSTFAFRLHCKVFKQFLSNLCSCLRDLYVTVVSL